MHPAEYQEQREPERLLSWPQIRPMTGDLGRVTVWRMIRRHEFPEPIAVSPGRKAWAESAILKWQAERAAKFEVA